MRILDVLRRRCLTRSPSGFLEWLVRGSHSHRSPLFTKNFISQSTGLSRHINKAKMDTCPGNFPACFSSRSSSRSSSRAWMDGWTKALFVITCDRHEGPGHVDAEHDHTGIGRGTKCQEEPPSKVKAYTLKALDQQFRMHQSLPIDHFQKWTFKNSFTEFNTGLLHSRSYSSNAADDAPTKVAAPKYHDESQRAVVMALWCNFLVLSFKCGVWVMTSSHVMLAEAVHSFADLANQALLAYGLVSSRRAPDDLHPYGYSKERFVWSLISAVGIFCLGSGATIVHGFSNLWSSEPPQNMSIAALVIGGSMVMEGVSLLVAVNAVRKGAAAEGMTLWDYCWRGHDPTAVAVMMEDGAAVTGLVIAGISLVAVSVTGNPIYDPIGSIFVGHLLGMVAIFLIQRNRHALLGRAMDNQDMKLVLDFLSSDPVVDAVYDCKSEVIGPRSYRFKAEIDFNGVAIVQNYLRRIGREAWAKEFREAVNDPEGVALDRVLSNYGEEVVLALGSEVDRLEREIQRLVPGIQHVDIETHNPNGLPPF